MYRDEYETRTILGRRPRIRYRIPLLIGVNIVMIMITIMSLFFILRYAASRDERLNNYLLLELDRNAPQWLHDYVSFCLAPDTGSTQYLVWACTGEFCGGIGDRVRGMITAFYLAVATGRKFRIHSPRPFPLQNTLHPATFDWTFSYWYWYRNPPHLCNVDKMIEFAETNRNVRVASIYTTAMGVYGLYSAPEFGDKFRGGDGVEIGPHNWDLLVTWAWSALFQPSPALQREMTQLYRDSGLDTNGDYIALHIRRGGHWGDGVRHGHDHDFQTFLDCARNVTELIQAPIYVASDDDQIKREFEAALPGAAVRYDLVPAQHIDRIRDRSTDLRLWAEFMILRQSACIVASRSGFSLWPAATSRDFVTGSRCWARFDHCSMEEIAAARNGPVPIYYGVVSSNDPNFFSAEKIGPSGIRFPCSTLTL